MKPSILGRIDPSCLKSCYRKQLRQQHLIRHGSVYLGDVDPKAIGFDEPVAQQLLKIVDEYDFKQSETYLYTGLCLMPLFGSVGWHNDEGLGLVLNWVIDSLELPGCVSDLTLNEGEITGRDYRLNVGLGDVFVFNASVGHAWISNKRTLLAQVPVSIKSKSQRASYENVQIQC
jgi:hypothetical protein